MAGGEERFCQANRISFSARKRSRFLLAVAFGMDARAMGERQKHALLFGRKNLRATRNATAP